MPGENVPVEFFWGKFNNLPQNYIDGRILITTDTGSMFLDKLKEDGTVERIVLGGNNKEPEAGGEIFVDYLNNKANGIYSAAFGTNTIANGYASFVAGEGTEIDQSGAAVFGSYNALDPEAKFVIGIGDSKNNRKNGFVVTKDGRALVSEITPIQDNELVTKKYIETYYVNQNIVNQQIDAILLELSDYIHTLVNTNVQIQS